MTVTPIAGRLAVHVEVSLPFHYFKAALEYKTIHVYINVVNIHQYAYVYISNAQDSSLYINIKKCQIILFS